MVQRPSRQPGLSDVGNSDACAALKALLPENATVSALDTSKEQKGPDGGLRVLLNFSDLTLLYDVLVFWREQVHPGRVAGLADMARAQAKRFGAQRGRTTFATVVAPYLTPKAFARCRENGLNAWDLCGNACLAVPGLHVWTQGHPNRFVEPKVAKSVFAPKASRIPRLLLMAEQRTWRVTELARAAEVHKGHASRVVSQLVKMQAVEKWNGGRIRLVDAELLLDRWTADYQLSRSLVGRYYAQGEGLEDVLEKLRPLYKREGEFALTGPWAASVMGVGLRTDKLHVFWSGDMSEIEELVGLELVQGGLTSISSAPMMIMSTADAGGSTAGRPSFATCSSTWTCTVSAPARARCRRH